MSSFGHFHFRDRLLQISPILWRGTWGREPGRIGAGGVREAGEERAGCGSSKSAGSGREMQNATCCHLLMRYNTLKNKSANDIWLALASSEQSSKQKFTLLLKNRPTSSEIVNPFTGGYIIEMSSGCRVTAARRQSVDLPQVDLTRIPGEHFWRANRDFSYAKWMSERRSRETSLARFSFEFRAKKAMTSFASPALDGTIR